ncbi:unnamed protein product [Prorocentrum cordatum]|uniref:Uncharacterized protein n=1 Tax=Prorocentrum cordatum TaxID=2364126 RepID=A0ABN9YIP3_9DINO|nr:unnamed protein product [Polarella glacialis]
MLVKSIWLGDRYIYGPQLARALGPRVRNAAEGCPAIDGADRVDDDGRLVGWEGVFDHALEKLDYTSRKDTGLLAEEFFLKIGRISGETFQDWAARFEKHDGELPTQLQAIDADVKEKSRLTPILRGEITATADGDFNSAKTNKTLLTRFLAEASAELDGKTKRERATFENDAGDDEYETGGEADEIYEMVEQLIKLAEENDDEDEPVDLDADNEAFAQFRQAGMMPRDARDLLRQVRVAKDYYPVGAPRDEDGHADKPKGADVDNRIGEYASKGRVT